MYIYVYVYMSVYKCLFMNVSVYMCIYMSMVSPVFDLSDEYVGFPVAASQ